MFLFYVLQLLHQSTDNNIAIIGSSFTADRSQSRISYCILIVNGLYHFHIVFKNLIFPWKDKQFCSGLTENP